MKLFLILLSGKLFSCKRMSKLSFQKRSGRVRNAAEKLMDVPRWKPTMFYLKFSFHSTQTLEVGSLFCLLDQFYKEAMTLVAPPPEDSIKEGSDQGS